MNRPTSKFNLGWFFYAEAYKKIFIKRTVRANGIPAIPHPKFISAEEAGLTFLKKGDRILGIVQNG